MHHKFKKFFIITMLFCTIISFNTAYADNLKPCEGRSGSETCQTNIGTFTGPGGVLTNVISSLLFIAGTIAVIMIIVGGIRYITSDGDAAKASQAKNTIIYAIIGLVITVMSYGIVAFVVGRL